MRLPLYSAALFMLVTACAPAEEAPELTAEDAILLSHRTLPPAWDRVDRMGMPAIATAVIASKDAYNQADPVDDAAGEFVGEIVELVTLYHSVLDDDLEAFDLTPCAVSECIAQAAPLVVPDTLFVDSTAPAGFPNGRGLADPVIDVTLAVVLLDLGVHSPALLAELPLNPPQNDRAFMDEFPYLAPPH